MYTFHYPCFPIYHNISLMSPVCRTLNFITAYKQTSVYSKPCWSFTRSMCMGQWFFSWCSTMSIRLVGRRCWILNEQAPAIRCAVGSTDVRTLWRHASRATHRLTEHQLVVRRQCLNPSGLTDQQHQSHSVLTGAANVVYLYRWIN
jgi:hypothetical protein